LAGRLLSIDSVRATSEIADVERIARTSLAEVREAIGGYRARGLAAEIEAARLTLDAAGVRLLAESLLSYSVALSSQEETAGSPRSHHQLSVTSVSSPKQADGAFQSKTTVSRSSFARVMDSVVCVNASSLLAASSQ
jgi:hypothetical protein